METARTDERDNMN